MQDIDLQWHPKKCNIIHVRRGKQVEDAADLKFGKETLVKNPEAGSSDKFLDVKESTLQDERLALAVAAKVYLAELREIDREPRKLVSENGGKHPLSSTAGVVGGRGMKSIEHEYKVIKVKPTINLYMNPDPMMISVRVFEERAAERGFASLVKDAHRYAVELSATLTLEPAESSCSSQSNPEKKITGHHVKQHLKEAVTTGLVENTAIIIRALGYRVVPQPSRGN